MPHQATPLPPPPSSSFQNPSFLNNKVGHEIDNLANWLNGNTATDKLNEAQNKRQEETYMRERAYDFRLAQRAEVNSVPNQVAGASAVGMSPMTASSIGGSGSAGATPQPTGGNAKGNAPNLISKALDLKQQKANLDLTEAQKDNVEATTEKTEAESENIGNQNQAYVDTKRSSYNAFKMKLDFIMMDENATEREKDTASALLSAIDENKFTDLTALSEAVKNGGANINEMSYNELAWRNKALVEEIRHNKKGNWQNPDQEQGILYDLAQMPDWEADNLNRMGSQISAMVSKLANDVSVGNAQIQKMDAEIKLLGKQLIQTIAQTNTIHDTNLMNTYRDYQNGNISFQDACVRIGLGFVNGLGKGAIAR